MGIQCGIVGLPNVGKSTLFNALTKAQIAAENYPFCTIDPNVGVVAVPDLRLQALAAIVKPQKILGATVEFVDIAGLVEGAAEGKGKGNAFLSHIRDTDAIAHVVRCFVDDDVIHVMDSVDPIRDIDVIGTELALADLDRVTKSLERSNKLARSGNAEAAARSACLTRVQAHLDNGEAVRSMSLSDDEKLIVKELQLITAKPGSTSPTLTKPVWAATNTLIGSKHWRPRKTPSWSLSAPRSKPKSPSLMTPTRKTFSTPWALKNRAWTA